MNRITGVHTANMASRSSPAVWLCSAGLTTALLAFSAILLVMVVQGCSVFTPKRVIEVTVRTDSADVTRTVTGVLLSKSSRGGPFEGEWKIRTGQGRKAAFFVEHIPVAHIVSERYPDGIATADAVSGPPVFFYPLALVRPGERISAEDPRFKARLRDALRSSEKAKERIESLRKGRLHEVRLALRGALRKQEALAIQPPGQSPLDNASALTERIGRLRAEAARHEAEMERWQSLRAEPSLELRMPDGSVQTRPLSDFTRIQFTNTMGSLARVVASFQNALHFVTAYPSQANTSGGIFPAIFSTFIMTLLMSVVVMPFGVVAAIYLREYARQGPFVQLVRIGVNNLAGVPSIVYGVFGLGFFVYILGGSIDALLFPGKLPNATFGTGGILWAALTLALMTVPVVIVATEDALAAVPKGTREASLACGASQLQTLLRVVLPASGPGILTGLILAIARGAGEVAPLMLVGVVKLAPALPVDADFPFIHLERKFMHLGYHIYDLAFQSPHPEASHPMVFATALLLILLVIALNLAAILIRRQLKARLQSGIF